jgi:hypothetical protein
MAWRSDSKVTISLTTLNGREPTTPGITRTSDESLLPGQHVSSKRPFSIVSNSTSQGCSLDVMLSTPNGLEGFCSGAVALPFGLALASSKAADLHTTQACASGFQLPSEVCWTLIFAPEIS